MPEYQTGAGLGRKGVGLERSGSFHLLSRRRNPDEVGGEWSKEGWKIGEVAAAPGLRVLPRRWSWSGRFAWLPQNRRMVRITEAVRYRWRSVYVAMTRLMVVKPYQDFQNSF